jgi:hypothetical protein
MVTTAAHDDLTRLAIGRALLTYGQFHETVAPVDIERRQQLERLAPQVASALDMQVSMAATSTRGGDLHVCALVVTAPVELELA